MTALEVGLLGIGAEAPEPISANTISNGDMVGGGGGPTGACCKWEVTTTKDARITQVTTDVSPAQVTDALTAEGYSTEVPGRPGRGNATIHRREPNDPTYTTRDTSDSGGPTLDVKKAGE